MELGGVYNGVQISSTTTTNTVDSATGTTTNEVIVTTESASGNGVNGGESHTLQTQHTSLFTDTTNWCLGRPQEMEVTRSHTMANGSAVTRHQETTWSGSMCRPTQVVAEPTDAQWEVTTDVTYDDFGNVEIETVTGVGMAARTTTITWNSTGQFATAVQNPLGQTAQLGWDLARGWRTGETDPNGIATSWQYDGFGRVTHETRPDNTSVAVAYDDCSVAGCLNALNTMTMTATEKDTSGSSITSQATYIDALERPIGVKSTSLSGADTLTKREYDAVGRVKRDSAPCWLSGCSTFWTTNTYDVLDRVTEISRPTSDTNSTLVYKNLYYEGLTTRTVDALSKQSTQIVTAIGEVTRTTDHDGYYQSFSLDAFGNLKSVTDSASVVWQVNAFNVRGMLLAQTDADRGAWSLTPNALGEIVSQTDANSATSTFAYDKLGRMTSRTESEGTSTWTWGTSAGSYNIGQLASVSGPGYSESYTYNSKRQLSSTSIISDTTYVIDRAYNNQGRLDTLTYPTSTSSYRLKLQYEYQYGRLLRVKDYNAPTTVFWEGSATDPRGGVIHEVLGNGLETVRGFDGVTGRVDYIQTGPSGTDTIQNLSYAWDVVGNLTQRQDLNQSVTETFYYDNLHRLDYSQRNGVTNLDLAYAANGNISSKADEGGSSYTYTYHATKKHAVTSASNGWSFAYDANGNMTSRNGSSISWYSYNLPNTINGASGSSQFFYAPDRSRYKQIADYGGTTETTLYVGGILEKMSRGGVTEYRHYIEAGPESTGVYTRRTSGTSTSMYYVTKDHIGSSSAVTDSTGSLLLNESLGAFGQRRGANWNGNPSSGDWAQISAVTRHGYTSHEHLDNLSLIHMNGRVYDPYLGRFLSADPFVPHPRHTQSYNRYSYARNNPVRFIDPSGFVDKESAFPTELGGGGEVREGPTISAPRVSPTGSLSLSGGGPGGTALYPHAYGTQIAKKDDIEEVVVCGGTKCKDTKSLWIRLLKIPFGWVDCIGMNCSGLKLASLFAGPIIAVAAPELKLLPALRVIHSAALIKKGAGKASYDYWSKQSTADIIKSLKPGANEPLTVNAAGAVYQGNTRITVLMERGFNVNSLTRMLLKDLR